MARLADAASATPPPPSVPRTRRLPVSASGLALAAIVLLGAAARFWRLDWDGGAYTFHPDEWALNNVVARLGPDGNPHFFFYGSLPIYLDRLTAEALRLVTGLDWLASVRLPLIGRAYSALASTALLPLVFVIGRRLWGAGAGLLAAACAASAPLLIQAAHFGTVDTAIALTGMLLLWAALRIAAGASLRWYLFSGVVLGLAVASKLTAASFLLLPLLAHLLRAPAQGHRPVAQSAGLGEQAVEQGSAPRRPAPWRGPLVLAGGALAALAVTAPYYVLAWPEFWQAVTVQTAELSGGYTFPYTWQFIGTIPYLFELQNLAVWGLGLPLGLAALGGWLWALATCVARIARRPPLPFPVTANALLLVAWPTLYLAYIGTWEARFVRHLLPLVPWVCLFAAGALVTLARWLRVRARNGKALGRLAQGAVLLGALGAGLAYLGVYAAPEPRTAATAWLRAAVPPDSVLVVEDKNDLVPVPAFVPPSTYQFKPLEVTAPDSPAKMGQFAAALAAGDDLILPNHRWAAVLPRLSAFPFTGQYYRLLLDGRLGYSLVATFAAPPRLGPLVFSDDSAEETFQVFDHPTVRVFRNTARLSETQLRTLLGAQ